MDEIAPEYDVIVLGTGQNSPKLPRIHPDVRSSREGERAKLISSPNACDLVSNMF